MRLKRDLLKFFFSTNNSPSVGKTKDFQFKAENSTYKRELQERIVTRFSSELGSLNNYLKASLFFSLLLGKKYFIEAIEQGTMQCFFPLSENFTTQGLPSTCGSTTLIMVLNALGIDPGLKWKG